MKSRPRSTSPWRRAAVACAAWFVAQPALPAVSSREAVGVFGGWGVFRDRVPPRCFAVAEPARSGGAGERGIAPFASVAFWPGRGVRGQLHVRLRRVKLLNAPVTLTIGDRRFRLVGGGADAWAPDWRVDAAVIATLRGATSMSIETRARDGKGFADAYALRGAATAIDAAALACR